MSSGVRLGLIVFVVLLTVASPALAHTGLVSSTPAQDASVDGPLEEVTLTFSRPIELAGDGVRVLDGQGDPVAVSATVDAEVVTVRPRQPLDDGPYGVRWAVRSGDAHPVRGTFVFTVTPAVTRAGSAGWVGGAVPLGSADGLTRALTAEAAHDGMVQRPEASADEPVQQARPDSAADPTSPVGGAASSLAAALAADPLRGIGWLNQALRAVFWVVALGAVGMLVFLIGVWDGPRREARNLTRLCTRLAAVTALVVVAQTVVRSAQTVGGWSEALPGLPSMLTGEYAIGTAMRVGGALLLAGGLGALRRTLSGTVHPIAGGAVDLRPAPAAVASGTPSAARRLRSAAIPVVAALLLIGSFAFVGHAATAQPRHVAVAAALAHSTAAAMWGGGLLGLVATLSARRRAGLPLRAGLIAVRFSVVATIGVTFAAAAGVALAAVRLDSVAALWSTSYGRVLVAKVAVVGVIAALGAYNHFVLIPRLRRDPHDAAGDHLRRLGLVEVSLLVVVAGLTSALISAAG